MKICYVFWRNSIGGLEKINRIYYDLILKSAYQINASFFILKPSSYNGFFRKNEEHVTFGSNNSYVAAFRYLGFLNRRRFDLIHLSNPGILILLITSLRCNNIIYHVHGTKYSNSKLKKYIDRFVWRNLCRRKKIVLLANSNFSKESFHQHFGEINKSIILYNPIDTNKFLYQERKITEVRTVFFIGRLTKGKNLHLWLENAIRLYNEHGISFKIVGEGPEKENLIQKIIKQGFDGSQIEGFTNEVEKVYHRNDILLFLSLHESFGNVIIESLLCGTPVLVLNIPVMQELLKDFPIFLIDGNDDLYPQIESKITDFENLILETERASEYFRVNFSVEKHFSQLNNIYACK